MTPLERACRALCRAQDGMDPAAFAAMTKEQQAEELLEMEEDENERWPEYADDVRAILKAIRDPSDAMMEAGWTSDLPFTPSVKVDVVWKAMIDAIVKGAEK